MKTIQSVQLVPPINVGLIEYTKKSLLSAFHGGRATKVKDAFGMALYQTGNEDAGAYFLVDGDNQDVPYFVKYTRTAIKEFSFGRQILVNRDSGRPDTVGVSQMVFNDILLPKFGAVVTDTEQSSAGQRLWDAMISQAFERGDFVYMIDLRDNAHVVKQTLSSREVTDAKIWGNDASYRGLLLAISQKPLGGL